MITGRQKSLRMCECCLENQTAERPLQMLTVRKLDINIRLRLMDKVQDTILEKEAEEVTDYATESLRIIFL